MVIIYYLGTFDKSNGMIVSIRESLNIVKVKKKYVLNFNSMHLTFKLNKLVFFY